MHNLARTLWLQDRRDEAIEMHRDVVKRREKLVEKFPKVIQFRAELGEAWYILGARLIDAGRRDEADKAFQQARDVRAKLVTDYPNNAAYHEALIWAQLALWDHAATAKALDDLMPLAPGDENLYARGSVLLTRCARLAGRDDSLSQAQRQEMSKRYSQRAIAYAQECLRRQPGNLVAHHDLAFALTNGHEPTVGELETATTHARRAAEARPSDAGFRATLGVVHYRAGRWKEATKELEEAIRLSRDPEKEINHKFYHPLFLTMSRWQLGEKDAAAKLFDEAREWRQKHLFDTANILSEFDEAAALLGRPDGADKKN
jgi:tetratricopeptide (TPR) repeat protein